MTQRERRRRQLVWMIHLWMRHHGTWFVLALFFCVSSLGTAFAAVKPIQKEAVKQEALSAPTSPQPAKKKAEKTVERTISGIVMFIRPNRLSIEFSRSEEQGGEDMLLSLDKKPKLKNVSDLSKIKQGDEVHVKFLETYLEPKEKGGQAVVLSRLAREISFVKHAPAPKASTEVLTGGEGL